MIKTSGRLLLRLLAGFLAALVLVLGVTAWRLSQGPISLGFLTPYVTDALNLSEAGLVVEVEDTVLAWGGWERTLLINAVDVRLHHGVEAQPFARIPRIAIDISLRSLLLGRFAVQRIDIEGAALAFDRHEDGRIRFGLLSLGATEAAEPAHTAAQDAAPGGEAEFLEGFLRTFAQSNDPATAMGALRSVRILSAAVTLTDRISGKVWAAPRSDLVILRSAEGVRAEFVSNLALGGRTARLLLDARYALATDSFDIQLVFDRLHLEPFLQQFEATAAFAGTEPLVSGRIETRLGPERVPSDFRFDIAAGPGALRWPNILPGPMALNQANIRGAYNLEARRLTLEKSFLEFAGGGALDIVGDAGFDLLDPALERIELRLDASLRNITTKQVVETWPKGVAVNAYDWIRENISNGGVSDARLVLRIAAGDLAKPKLPTDAVSFEFNYAGLRLHYLRPMTPLENLAGRARLNADEFSVQVISGNAGPIAISEGRVAIRDLQGAVQMTDIEFVTAAAAREVLALLDQKPLGFPSRIGLDPATVAGSASVRARISFPAVANLKIEDLRIQAAANIRDAVVPRIAERFNLTNGAFLLQVTQNALQATGTASVNGVPFGVEWSEDFTGREANSARYRLTGIVDDRGREALGLSFKPYLAGPAAADVTIATPRAGGTLVQGRLNLQDSVLDIAELGWRKPSGAAADLAFNLVLRTGQITEVREARLTSPSARGNFSGLWRGDQMQALVLNDWAEGRNAFAGRIDRQQDGSLNARLQGRAADLRRLFKSEGKPAPAPNAPPPTDPPLRFDVNFAEARMSDDLTVRNLAASGLLNAAREPMQLNAQAGFAEGSGFELSVRPDGQGRRLALTSENGGVLMRFFGLTSVQGGRARVEGRYASNALGAPLQGLAVMENFSVVEAPVLARLLTLGSITGIAETLGGQGISFDRADIPFTLERDILRLNSAKAYGASLGLTAQGTIDTNANRIALTGTIIPAYTVNSILGNIPLIGPILTGRQGEGILGITYNMTGETDDPQIAINPLSLLAPGFLRRLFEPADPNAPLPPTPQQESTR